jgi:hypothetical protein
MMSTTEQRQNLLHLIAKACADGARLAQVCAQIGLSERTVQRWQRPHAHAGDRRVCELRTRAEPPNKLSAFERQAALALLNSDEFKDLPPSKSYPAWPIWAATSPANRPCTGCCEKAVKSNTAGLSA